MQLGDDRPSHTLVPAIHRNRSESKEIFTRQMAAYGRPAPEGLTDCPADLAVAARLHLRSNGRMSLPLPQTLITVTGIERVLPAWSDLEAYLQLLPRSSTGERMNPYTSTWRGVTPGDAPQEFHLVLLDNGRTATPADTVGCQALGCIRC